MTTEKLIIDGVDHSKFDLEWAKRGGVCAIADHSEFGLFKYIRPIDKALHYFCDIEYLNDFGATMIPNDMRMATPAECEAAGIEYIEYHGWRPIESAPIDEPVLMTDGKHCSVGTKFGEHAIVTENILVDPTLWMPLLQPPKDE